MLMSRFQCGCDLARIGQAFSQRQGTFADADGQGFAFDQLHHQVIRPYIVQSANIWMIQRRRRPRFVRKAILKPAGGHFDRHRPAQARIFRGIDAAHPTFAENARQAIRSKP